MSDGSRVLVSYYEEVVSSVATYKGVPSPLTLKDLRNVSEGIVPDYAFVQSEENTSDRTVRDTTMTAVSARGPINGEFSYATYDDMMRWAIATDATWSTAATFLGTSLTVSAVNKFKRTGSAFTGIIPGDWIRVRGAPNSANDGWYYVQNNVVTGSDAEITVRPNTLTVDATTSASFEIETGERIRNGTTQAWFGIERDYGSPLATAQRFVNIPGCSIGGLSLGFALRAINNITLDILGAEETSRTATIGTTANTAAGTNPVMNSIRNVKAFRIDQAVTKARSIQVAFRNELREQENIGTFGLDSIDLGPITCEISWESYYLDKTLANAARNETELDISIVLEDNAGNGYVFYWPRTKIKSATRIGGGKRTNVLMRCTAEMLKGTLEAIQIARFPN